MTTLAANALGFSTVSTRNNHFLPLTHTTCPGPSASLLPSHTVLHIYRSSRFYIYLAEMTLLRPLPTDPF